MRFTEDFRDVNFLNFRSFIENISDDFVPPLIPRIDIESYYDKLKTLSDTLFCLDGDDVVGISATYCNNYITRKAYTTLVGVDKRYRGMHIATEMMNRTILLARNKGMMSIGIHTNNIIAKDLYLKVGFMLVGEKLIDNELVRYYLERDL